MTEAQITKREYYKKLASVRRDEALKKSFKASSKREYLMGVQMKSKRDIMSELRTDLININQQCVGEGLNPIFMDEEEEDVKLPSLID